MLFRGCGPAPEPPAWAVPVASRHSGYVQAVHPGTLLPCAARHGVCLRVRARVGEHVVAGTTLAERCRRGLPSPREAAEVLKELGKLK